MSVIENSIEVYKNMAKARTQDCINYKKELERYKNIIDKTVEYVERLTNGKTSRIDTWENVEFVLEMILQILKGE